MQPNQNTCTQIDRSQGIGCSDLPAIMNVSPWSNPYKKWREKVYGQNDQKDNPAMQYGRETEPLIREKVCLKLGVSLDPIRIVHPYKLWLWASLDGFNPEKKVIAEFKTASAPDHLLAVAGQVPGKYWPQVQGQMEVVGIDSLYYCSYYGGDLEILEVKRDPEYCKDLMNKVDTFWECVALERPPEGYICMEDNETWNHTAKELESIIGQIKALEDKEISLTHQLKALSQGHSAIGQSLFYEKTECNGAVNYKKAVEDYISNLKADHPEISFPEVPFEAYRKKSFEKWSLKPIKRE